MKGLIRMLPGTLVSPIPGYGGTIFYLAPEREIQNYDYLVDVWSMGVVLYEITYEYHPWKFDLNPLSPGNENMRPTFHSKYSDALS
jgi:serine/threonine protein kinase